MLAERRSTWRTTRKWLKFSSRGGADVHAQDHGGSTPLHAQAHRHYDEASIAQLLLSHGADANSPDNSLKTPLHWAAYNFQRRVVSVLLEHGADPTAKNGDGHTALFGASRDLRDDHIFVLAHEPKPEAIHGVLSLLREHELKG